MSNFNHAHYLPESLGPICDQTRPADEVIVVDDGSTDESIDVIMSYARRCPKLVLLRNDRNRGVQYSINRALDAASGDYIVWASADDKLLPHFLERSLAPLKEHPSAGLCFSQLAVFVDGTDVVRRYDGARGPEFDLGSEPHFLGPDQLLERLRRSYLWMSGNTVVVRRAALLEAGGFRPALRWHSEWLVYYVVALRYGACAIPETLAMMRERLGTYSATGMNNPQQQREVLRAMVEVIRSPEYRDVLPVFRRRPVLLSPLGRQMLYVLGSSLRSVDLAVPFFGWHLRHQCRKLSGRLRHLLVVIARRSFRVFMGRRRAGG
jgi:glycosyltransferase involved in cell wall biosynthesis